MTRGCSRVSLQTCTNKLKSKKLLAKNQIEMKKLVVLLLAVVVASGSVAMPAFAVSTEDIWVSLAEMPTARGALQTAVVNGKIYAIGGSGPIGVNEVYDPATDNWMTKAPMPIPQQNFAIAVYEGKIYCLGGEGNETANQVYDPANDTWQIKSSLPTGRYSLEAHTIDDEIYVIGGVRELGHGLGIEDLNVTEAYNPSTDTWTTKSPKPNPMGYVSAIVDDRIYLISAEVTQIYDPQTDTWSTGAPPKSSNRFGIQVTCTAAATTGVMAPKRIYLYDDSIMQVYNPYNDSWATVAPPPTNSREYAAFAVVDDQLYLIGGFTEWWQSIDHAANERYTPFGYGTPQPTTTVAPSGWQAESFSTAQVTLVSIAVAATAAVIAVSIYTAKRKHYAKA